MGKCFVMGALAVLLLTVSAAQSARAADYSGRAFLLNGAGLTLDSHVSGGSYYVNPFELAYALRETGKRFTAVRQGTAFILSPESPGLSASALSAPDQTPSAAGLLVQAARIGAAYYAKLRDLAMALNFSVRWNTAQKTISIDTTQAYTLEPETALQETEDMGQDYQDSIIFLGDSTTYGLLAYSALPGGRQSNQVWTPANRTFTLSNQRNIRILYPDTDTDISLEQAAELKKPAYMVITLGINGVSFMTEDSFKSHYREMIGRILAASPETKIILNSIYPVTHAYKKLDSINNEKITRANGWVYDIADELGLRYADSASVLKDEEGWLRTEYQNGDGMHLTLAAFRQVLGYLRTHGWR